MVNAVGMIYMSLSSHFILGPSSVCVTLYPFSEAQYHYLRGICKQSCLSPLANRISKFITAIGTCD